MGDEGRAAATRLTTRSVWATQARAVPFPFLTGWAVETGVGGAELGWGAGAGKKKKKRHALKRINGMLSIEDG